MNDFFTRFAAAERRRLAEASRLRETPDIDHGADRQLLFQGKPRLNLASNNYLGLAGSPDLIQAAVAATRTYGTSSGASRLVCGTSKVHDDLDAALARFKGTQAALALGSGYAANLAVFAAFADRHTVVFADKLSHASIIDGVALSGARLVRFRHNDMGHLAELFHKHADAPRKIAVTESVFSMDGDVPDLSAFVSLCEEHEALSVIDEAHAVGVFGQGRGVARALGLDGRVGVQMGTLSKALGSCGGYLCASGDFISLIANRGRSFIYSTAVPASVAAASLAAIELILKRAEAGEDAGAQLLAMAASVRDYLKDLGFDTGESASQIVPVILGADDRTLCAREFLIGQGIFAAAIRPPTVPEGTARLRLSLRADLTDEDMALVREAFAKLAKAGYASC